MKKYISKVLTVVVVIVFALYFYNHIDEFKSLLSVSPIYILLLLALNILRINNNGSFLRYTMAFYKTNVGAFEAFYIGLITYIGNFFGPALGGAGARALYLKKKHNFSYSDFLATLTGFYFVTFIVNAAIGLLALITIHQQTGVHSWLLYLAFVGWLCASIYLSRVRSIEGIYRYAQSKIAFLQKPFGYINKSVKSWQGIKGHKKIYRQLYAVTFRGFLILFAITYVEFLAIGANDVSLAAISLYVTLIALSLLVSITPGALGIREALLIFTSELLGLNTNQILAIAIIDRATLFVVLLIGYGAIKISGFLKKRS